MHYNNCLWLFGSCFVGLGYRYLFHIIAHLIWKFWMNDWVLKITKTPSLDVSGMKTFPELWELKVSLSESQHFEVLLLCQLLRVPDKIFPLGFMWYNLIISLDRRKWHQYLWMIRLGVLPETLCIWPWLHEETEFKIWMTLLDRGLTRH